MNDSQAACAHIHVEYVRVEENGRYRDTWRCKSGCAAYFWPSLQATAPMDKLNYTELAKNVTWKRQVHWDWGRVYLLPLLYVGRYNVSNIVEDAGPNWLFSFGWLFLAFSLWRYQSPSTIISVHYGDPDATVLCDPSRRET